MSEPEEPVVNNANAILALELVEEFGERRSYWLKKMQTGIKAMVDRGEQVSQAEITEMLLCMKNDHKIGEPATAA